MITLKSSKVNEVKQLEKCRVFSLLAHKWIYFNNIRITKKKKQRVTPN